MKKIAYIGAWISSILILSLLYFYFVVWTTSANPDYICIKDVSRSCEVENCWDWQSDWTRVCTWTRTTQVAYYLTRTSCEAWYTQIRWGGYTWWASWRKTADFTYQSVNCSITQTDKTSPFWDTEVINN